MRKTVVTVALALIPMSFAHAQVPAAERAALIALYDSTDGDHWSNATYKWKKSGGIEFKDPGTECSWYGVSCYTAFDEVFSLRLGDNNLSGTIPPELGNLAKLRTLNLSDNQLTGGIPPELGNNSFLREVWLSNNQLTGSIPPDLGGITTLLKLVLSRNQLSGSIPPELGDLSNLFYLALSLNDLSGTIPPELGDLTSLTTGLQLSSNQLTGSIPPELGNLVDANYLHLNDNQLSGSIPPELGDLVSLWQLWLHENQLSGTIPPELADLPVIEQLYLYSNQLDGRIPPEFGTMTAPVSLSLSDNRLSGSIPPELGNMTAVLDLSMTSNQLSGEIPTELTSLSTLVNMELSFNALSWTNPALVAFLEAKHHYDTLWKMSQTVAPGGLMVAPPPFPVGDHTIWLMWTPIDYQMDPGGYEVFSSPSGSGVWTSGGWNDNKADPVFPVIGLDPGTTYDLAVASYTDPHTYNQNLLTSDLTTPVTMTTASTGCGQPVITATGSGPFTLSLTKSYDSYGWSTMETTHSIVVDPTSQTWYTVAVTFGACSEAAAILVTPIEPLVFSDGFESGDTTEWSRTVP